MSEFFIAGFFVTLGVAAAGLLVTLAVVAIAGLIDAIWGRE